MGRRKGWAAALAVLVALPVLAACGDGDGDGERGDGAARDAGASPGAGAGPPVALPGPVAGGEVADRSGAGGAPGVELSAQDSRFAPTYVRVAPGAAVTVTVRNDGRLPHNLRVDGQDVDLDLAPGATGTATVRMPAGGSVRFFCEIHVGAGMQGALYVADGSRPATAGAPGAPGSGQPGY